MCQSNFIDHSILKHADEFVIVHVFQGNENSHSPFIDFYEKCCEESHLNRTCQKAEKPPKHLCQQE